MGGRTIVHGSRKVNFRIIKGHYEIIYVRDSDILMGILVLFAHQERYSELLMRTVKMLPGLEEQ